MDVKDSNGNLLNAGDSVHLIKALKVKGTSVTLKRVTVITNIRLTSDEEEIECNTDKIKGLVLKTCFLKKSLSLVAVRQGPKVPSSNPCNFA